jgi:AcrR family transcriptional regulator
MLTPRRTDARRNRQIILRVANEALAEGSDAVSLEEIARRAGLGRATVYRHFPDRQALGAAVVAEQLAVLRRVVAAAEREQHSFRDLLHLVLRTQVASRPLVHLLRELPERVQRQQANAVIAILTPPLRRGQAQGRIRADVQPADLTLVFAMLEAALAVLPAASEAAAAQRLIAVVLDGLCDRCSCAAGAPAPG